MDNSQKMFQIFLKKKFDSILKEEDHPTKVISLLRSFTQQYKIQLDYTAIENGSETIGFMVANAIGINQVRKLSYSREVEGTI